MIRRIIKIDREKCNGCGACAAACHEGAIEIVDGKAVLTRENYCDGLGDCLPECPAEAITFEEREAPAYDEAAVLAAKKEKSEAPKRNSASREPHAVSFLAQWPCQIKLAPGAAPYFNNADLLLAADCTAYARASFHEDYMKGKVTLIGCPKLDSTDYSIKLTEILKNNHIQSVLVLRMEVPCCKGLETAAKKAVQNCGKDVECRVVTLGIDGTVKG